MIAQSIQKYLQKGEEAFDQECKEFISTLPTKNGWPNLSHFYLYQSFWYLPHHLEAVISCQKHFQAQDSDVFLATYPKCGTTWLKAIIFTLLNREEYPVESENHPLRTTNPHCLAVSMEIDIHGDNGIPNPASDPSRRFFATHMPYNALPRSSKDSSKCKLVYACRNPRDTFVSLWHFTNNLGFSGTGIGEAFAMFCEGAVAFGPFWDHVLEYWKASRESPDTVLFLKYEDMKAEPAVHLRRIAEFLDCPFSAEEEEAGVVEKILKLTSFDSLRSMTVNTSGRLGNGIENKHFFRKGIVGDGKKCLSDEMMEKLDGITKEKLFGSGLVL